MKASIIIPCFNLGRYLQDAISSVEAQTYTDWEIIIVDDGSTEKETGIALNKIKNQGKYTVIKQKNSGPSIARNQGIQKAKGKYIACLDADDMLAPDYLEKTILALENDKSGKVAVATTWLREFGERGDIWETGNYNVPQLLIANQLHVASIFKKSVWQEVGGYKPGEIQGYEDWEFWLSIAEKGYEWACIPEPLFRYRIRTGSLLSTVKNAHLNKYHLLYSLHPELYKKYAKELIIENAKEIKSLHEVIKEKNETIEEYEQYKDEVINLRAQLFKIRDEMHTMKNSRVLGRIIRLREFVGESRHRLTELPRRSIHEIRVVAAPFIPGPTRRFIKRAYRRVRSANHAQPIQVVRVRNEIRGASLPLVSVIVPYYNREDTVDDTIDSLLSQTFNNFETILVDDGSTEELSIKKLKEISKKNPWIKIIHQENQGVSAARNNGINQAKGKYIICLDSDDILEPTYIEKSTLVLETDSDTSLTTTYMNIFGVMTEPYEHISYNPMQLIKNNMVITAAQYRKEAWKAVGGYKNGIGYEDWEFWVNLAEHGFWGRLIPEILFRYRTSMQSRYIEDKDVHWNNLKKIRELHPQYKNKIKKIRANRRYRKHIVEPETALANLGDPKHYAEYENNKPNILIAIPWMTFGGAETLIINFCEEIKDNFNLSFITGLESEHEWEYKFKQITERVYHLRNLFENPALDIEFISNYIKTRDVDIIHIIHTSFAFELLPEIKKRHPNIKVSVTVFNDRADHFNNSVKFQEYIDSFSTDNNAVSDHYRKKLESDRKIITIPNGINSNDIYNPVLFDRTKERKTLNLADTDLAVFFIGRLAEEKNVDIFLEVGRRVVHTNKNIKFFVIGDGNLRPAVEKQVKSIGSHNVQYLGYQSEIAKYLSAADIFVLPSSIEGFPLSILEAMAMKVAVVASDVGAVSDIIESGEDGLIVTPGSEDEIEAAIQKLSADAKLLEKIKSNARKKIDKKYSNTVLGANYKKLFNGIIK